MVPVSVRWGCAAHITRNLLGATETALLAKLQSSEYCFHIYVFFFNYFCLFSFMFYERIHYAVYTGLKHTVQLRLAQSCDPPASASTLSLELVKNGLGEYLPLFLKYLRVLESICQNR